MREKIHERAVCLTVVFIIYNSTTSIGSTKSSAALAANIAIQSIGILTKPGLLINPSRMINHSVSVMSNFDAFTIETAGLFGIIVCLTCKRALTGFFG